MITDGHMQYLFDEKGKRYERKRGFPLVLVSVVVVVRPRNLDQRKLPLSYLKTFSTLSLSLSYPSNAGTSTPLPGSSPSRSATATLESSRPSRTRR